MAALWATVFVLTALAIGLRWLTDVDEGVGTTVYRAVHASPLLTWLVNEAAPLTGRPRRPVIAGATVAAMLLIVARQWRSALLFLVSVGGGALFEVVVHGFLPPLPHMGRVRSFPSGHAFIAFVGFGTLAYLVFQLSRRRVVTTAVTSLAILFILFAGIERLAAEAHGVHSPSDVVGGYALGGFWVSAMVVIDQATGWTRTRKPCSRP